MRIGKKNGRKKERKRGKKHRSMPRGIGFFPRFPAKGISDEKLAVLFKYQWANGCNKQHGCFFPAWNLCQEFRRIIKVRPPSPRLFREFAMVSRFPRVWMRLFFFGNYFFLLDNSFFSLCLFFFSSLVRSWYISFFVNGCSSNNVGKLEMIDRFREIEFHVFMGDSSFSFIFLFSNLRVFQKKLFSFKLFPCFVKEEFNF